MPKEGFYWDRTEIITTVYHYRKLNQDFFQRCLLFLRFLLFVNAVYKANVFCQMQLFFTVNAALSSKDLHMRQSSQVSCLNAKV